MFALKCFRYSPSWEGWCKGAVYIKNRLRPFTGYVFIAVGPKNFEWIQKAKRKFCMFWFQFCWPMPINKNIPGCVPGPHLWHDITDHIYFQNLSDKDMKKARLHSLDFRIPAWRWIFVPRKCPVLSGHGMRIKGHSCTGPVPISEPHARNDGPTQPLVVLWLFRGPAGSIRKTSGREHLRTHMFRCGFAHAFPHVHPFKIGAQPFQCNKNVKGHARKHVSVRRFPPACAHVCTWW